VIPGQSGRFLLLALKGEHVEHRLLAYAASLCRRMDAGLDILLTSGVESLTPQLDNFVRELREEGVQCRLTKEAGLCSKDIVQYANAHARISTVVIDAISHWVASGDAKHNDPWCKLDCPLVVAIPD
jgi:hypothetical protein